MSNLDVKKINPQFYAFYHNPVNALRNTPCIKQDIVVENAPPSCSLTGMDKYQ